MRKERSLWISSIPVVGVAEQCQVVLVHVLSDVQTVCLDDLLVLCQLILLIEQHPAIIFTL